MTYILSQQLLGIKYSKWIVILQEFDLEFKKSKSKKSLVFSELLCDLPSSSNDLTSEASILDDSLFLSCQVIHGMEIYWSISRPKLSGLIPLALNSDIPDTKPNII